MEEHILNCVRKQTAFYVLVINPGFIIICVRDDFKGIALIFVMNVFPGFKRVFIPDPKFGFRTIDPCIPNLMRIEDMTEKSDAFRWHFLQVATGIDKLFITEKIVIKKLIKETAASTSNKLL